MHKRYHEDVIFDASGTLSNTKAEVIKLKSGFTVTNTDGTYSMEDILLSEETGKAIGYQVVALSM